MRMPIGPPQPNDSELIVIVNAPPPARRQQVVVPATEGEAATRAGRIGTDASGRAAEVDQTVLARVGDAAKGQTTNRLALKPDVDVTQTERWPSPLRASALFGLDARPPSSAVCEAPEVRALSPQSSRML